MVFSLNAKFICGLNFFVPYFCCCCCSFCSKIFTCFLYYVFYYKRILQFSSSFSLLFPVSVLLRKIHRIYVDQVKFKEETILGRVFYESLWAFITSKQTITILCRINFYFVVCRWHRFFVAVVIGLHGYGYCYLL